MLEEHSYTLLYCIYNMNCKCTYIFSNWIWYKMSVAHLRFSDPCFLLSVVLSSSILFIFYLSPDVWSQLQSINLGRKYPFMRSFNGNSSFYAPLQGRFIVKKYIVALLKILCRTADWFSIKLCTKKWISDASENFFAQQPFGRKWIWT